MCFHFVNWVCGRLTEDADFDKKNHLFRWNSFWSWRVCKQAKLLHLDIENSHTYIDNPAFPKWVTVWCEFWFRGIIEPFFFENEQGSLQSMAIVIGPCWTNFCSQKLERRILATFGVSWMALRATQPKLHSMFCALYLWVPSNISDNWRFKRQYSWSHWWNTAAHNR